MATRIGRKRRGTRLRRAVVAGSATLMALTACGGSGGTDAGTWVGTFCGAASAFQSTVTSSQPSLPSTVTGSDVLAATKTLMSNFMGTMVTAANKMVSKVQDAGAPDVANGQGIENDIVDSLKSLANSLSADKAKVDGLSTTDSNAFTAGLQAVGNDLNSLGNTISDTFSKLGQKYKSSNLDSAAKSQPACQSLNSSG